MRAILTADVDLCWFGGIGTFVKASRETHADVGDRTNDALRIDAPQLRAKVVGEGANLALTQRARVELGLRRHPAEHRRDRQLGRRGLLRPRGQHQDPAARRGEEGRPHAPGPQRAAAHHDRRGGRPGAAGQLPADAGHLSHAGPEQPPGGPHRPLHALAGGRGQAQPAHRGPAGRRDARGAPRRGVRALRAGRAARLRQDRPVRRAAGLRPAGRPGHGAGAPALLPHGAAHQARRGDRPPQAAARDHRDGAHQPDREPRRHHLRPRGEREDGPRGARRVARLRRGSRHLPHARALGRGGGAGRPGGGARPGPDPGRGGAPDRALGRVAPARGACSRSTSAPSPRRTPRG